MTLTLPYYPLMPQRTWYSVPWREYWAYRDLLLFFVWKELRVRYAQSILGLGWALIQPLSTAAVFSLLLGKWGKLNTGVPGDIPYPLFIYIGTVTWTYCSNAITEGANSLIGNSNMVSKIYFPKIFLPLSGHVAKLLDFGIAALLILPALAYYGLWQAHWGAYLWLLVGLLHLVLMGLSLSLWCCALSVQYRDVKYALGFVMQLLLYLSPVLYSPQLIPQKYAFLQGLNPLVSGLEAFRYILIPHYPVDWQLMLSSAASGWFLLAGGVLYFEHMQAQFADLI
jgi:lipopolysaccharide transport system permease protein